MAEILAIASAQRVFQRRPDGSRRELTQRHRPDDVDERLQDFPLGAAWLQECSHDDLDEIYIAADLVGDT